MTEEELDIEIKALEEQRDKASVVLQRATGALEFAVFMKKRMFSKEENKNG